MVLFGGYGNTFDWIGDFIGGGECFCGLSALSVTGRKERQSGRFAVDATTIA
jgi:hypothetical protein